MYNKISKILFIALVVAILSYIFYYNSDPVTLKLGDSYQRSMPLALLLVISFFLGVFCLGLSILFLGLKMKYTLWKSNKNIAEKEKHFQELTQAKDLLALGNLKESSSLLNKIISRDPHNLIARVLQSDVCLKDGRNDDAITILEKARAEERNSPSLLLKLADIYKSQGNLSAAYDNLVLALKNNPKSSLLLNDIIQITRNLKKFKEAKNYANTLLKVCPYSEQETIQFLLADIQIQEAKSLFSENTSEYKEAIGLIAKEHKNYSAAQIELANLQIKSGESEHALKTLKKLITANYSVAALEKLVTFWLESKNPTDAIASLKLAIGSNDKELKFSAQLLLIQVLIYLESTEEAKDLLADIKQNVNNAPKFESFIAALQAKLELKTPGRSSTNLALEQLILKEAHVINIPSLPPKLLQPNFIK
jgi:predicted Zn-dependent protease